MYLFVLSVHCLAWNFAKKMATPPPPIFKNVMKILLKFYVSSSFSITVELKNMCINSMSYVFVFKEKKNSLSNIGN